MDSQKTAWPFPCSYFLTFLFQLFFIEGYFYTSQGWDFVLYICSSVNKDILTLFSLKSSMEYQVTFVQGMLNLSKRITPAFPNSTINL